MLYHPVEDLSTAFNAAILRDLPTVSQRVRDNDAWAKISRGEQGERYRRSRAGDQTAIPMTMQERRPYPREVEVNMFAQNWPTSSLGFNWEGKAERTDAYTIIVSLTDTHAVYFGNRFAYLVVGALENGRPRQDAGWTAFRQDVADHVLVDCKTAVKKYRAILYSRNGRGASED